MYSSWDTPSANLAMQVDQYANPCHVDSQCHQSSIQQHNTDGYATPRLPAGQRPPFYQGSIDSHGTITHSSNFPQQIPPQTSLPATAATHANVKPIVIPATTAVLGSPLLRAYPPSLASRNISRELFLQFLDDLNRVAVKSPPLQVLGLAGTIVSFVPLSTTLIAGAAIQAAAKLGTAAISKGRTEMFLREANRTIFVPRGLKAEIGKIEAVVTIAGIPGVLDARGKIDKKSSILPALEETENGEPTVSGQKRRMKWLEPYVQHLEVELLPHIGKPGNLISQWGVMASERERKRGEKKMVKGRDKVREKYEENSQKAREGLQKYMRELDEEEDKIRRKDEKKMKRKLGKVEQERRKVVEEYEEELVKVEKSRRQGDVEEKSLRKVLWLIIREIDAT